MKAYKFLIPIGIAASALVGNAVKADVTQPEAKTEFVADSSTAAAERPFVHKYIADGEEHTLLLRVGDQGVLYAQHVSHSSHSSHHSHYSHRSGS